MRTPHKWADVIKAAADGYDIEYYDGESWYSCTLYFLLVNDNRLNFRVKPEKIYPVTSIPLDALFIIFDAEEKAPKGLYKVANAAIRRYIDDMESDV